MALYLPRRWRQQPSYPTGINWSHPSARGLVGAFNFGVSLRNIPDGRTATITGTVTQGASPAGAGRVIAADASFLQLPNFKEPAYTVKEITSLLVLDGDATSSSRGYGCMGWSSESSHYPYSGTVYLDDFLSFRTSFTPLVDLDSPHTLGIQYKDGLWRASQNGKQGALATPNDGFWGWNENKGYFGQSAAGTGYWLSARILAYYVWARYVPDAELAELSKHHSLAWQLLQPARTPLFFFTSGGAETTNASIAATDSSDATAISTTVTTGSAIAATDSSDTTTASATSALASIAATNSSDVASITALETLIVAVAATDSSDTASITGNANVGVTNATISATDNSDTTAITTTVTTGAQIVALDAADSIIVTASTTLGAVIAATDSADATAITAGTGVTNASIAVADYSDVSYLLAESSIWTQIGAANATWTPNGAAATTWTEIN